MGGPTSSYVTAGIALRVVGVLKPPYHDKVETPRGGFYGMVRFKVYSNVCRGWFSVDINIYCGGESSYLQV